MNYGSLIKRIIFDNVYAPDLAILTIKSHFPPRCSVPSLSSSTPPRPHRTPASNSRTTAPPHYRTNNAPQLPTAITPDTPHRPIYHTPPHLSTATPVPRTSPTATTPTTHPSAAQDTYTHTHIHTLSARRGHTLPHTHTPLISTPLIYHARGRNLHSSHSPFNKVS
ncbi:hypothetical protein P167DRAFT_609993 [Morchella conica CCBAS932]|uniref:Uncharacterized protein n=1 Tax=Morchella conica CCBAS932 TaxID=1392247 RepID=A0A3N4K7U4_9PEZI|nr:hypothetical protein P167DRAFT_609993 [Morchella conica CCBAS932]